MSLFGSVNVNLQAVNLQFGSGYYEVLFNGATPTAVNKHVRSVNGMSVVSLWTSNQAPVAEAQTAISKAMAQLGLA